jgi:hypothetical protein
MKQRLAFRTRKQWRVDLVAVLCLALGLGLVAFAVVPALRIAANTETAAGVVLQKRFGERSEDSFPTYDLRYGFRASTGGEYGGWAGVDEGVYKKTVIGDRIAVRYAADDPSISAAVVNPPFEQLFEAAVVVAQQIGFFAYLGPRRWRRTLRGEPDPGPWT